MNEKRNRQNNSELNKEVSRIMYETGYGIIVLLFSKRGSEAGSTAESGANVGGFLVDVTLSTFALQNMFPVE